MRWARGLLVGIGLSMAASAALACPDRACNERDRAYHGESYRADDRGDGQAYRDEDAYRDDRYGSDARDTADYGDDAVYRDERDGYDSYGWRDDDGYADEQAWRKPDGSWYIHGHRGAPCACRDWSSGGAVLGGLRVNDSFFADAGGVGPIPMDGGYGGGGFVFVDNGGSAFSGASSRSFARASAHASANVAVRFRGGFKGGHGGKGGYGGKKGH